MSRKRRVETDAAGDVVAFGTPGDAVPPASAGDAVASGSPAGRLSRRALLGGALGALGGAALVGIPAGALGQKAAPPPAGAAPEGELPPVPDDPTKLTGSPTTPVSVRSRFENPQRTPTGDAAGNSLTPLQDLTGTLTPADLHFERHHAGIPLIDPARHRLLIHGLVDRPLVFTVAELKRFPAVTRTHFIECSGNGRAAYRAPKPEMDPQHVDGLTSNTEWTGVPLSLLLREAGVRPGAKWLLAEGSDAALLARSVPLEKAMDDALVVWGQNGEALRPANGYPIRLLLPGWEGNTNVKWLRRLKLGEAPFMTRWETSKYTDPLPNGTARIFSFEQDVKSIITSPRVLTGPGWWEISGLAWTGRGRIDRVEVSTDGGRSWQEAQLQHPVLPKAHTRFGLPWRWDGRRAVLMSRATDETGAVQPTRAVFTQVRGKGTDFHFNHIRAWRVGPDGKVSFDTGEEALA